MKNIKKIIAVVLAVLMMSSVLTLCSAAEDDSVTKTFLNINVAGLPDFLALIGKGTTDKEANAKAFGKLINDGGYDIVAVQEDFGYHDSLISGMSSYSYKTKSSGSVPGGDGLNIMTKSNPVYDATRITWNSLYGPIEEGDALTPKGILYTVIDLGNGIYLDFYDIHADAFDGDGNALSRADNYKQVLDYINSHSADRPVIITGDFNTSLNIRNNGDNGADEVAMLELFYKQNGFKDAWIELYNEGNYTDFSKWYSTGVHYWGHWDSVEKFYYRDGGGVAISADTFEYHQFLDSNGVNLSDHNGAVCTFTFTKTAEFVKDTRSHKVVNESDFLVFINTVRWIFKDLSYVFTHFDEIVALAKEYL